MRHQLGDSRTASELGIPNISADQMYFYVECLVPGGHDPVSGITRYVPTNGWVTLDGQTGILESRFIEANLVS